MKTVTRLIAPVLCVLVGVAQTGFVHAQTSPAPASAAEAKNAIEAGLFKDSEPGPYRIIAVYTVEHENAA